MEIPPIITDDYKIYNTDCRVAIKDLMANSIDLIVTDPPYFIDGMGDDWNDARLTKKTSHSGVVGGLPIGMKFDRDQGSHLEEFLKPLAKEFIRVLKPGAFCIVFSQGRLYHRAGMALDTAGFEIRDMLGWVYMGQPKAFSLSHFIKKDKTLTESQKDALIARLSEWKTPQLKPQIEPMTLAQKPREGTFIDNFIKYGVGLMNSTESLDGTFPGNIMAVPKRVRAKETSKKIDHLTVKPVTLIAHLIRLFTQKGQVVLDPFMGSGSHGVAALENNRKFIGYEIESKYFNIACERLSDVATESERDCHQKNLIQVI